MKLTPEFIGRHHLYDWNNAKLKNPETICNLQYINIIATHEKGKVNDDNVDDFDDQDVHLTGNGKSALTLSYLERLRRDDRVLKHQTVVRQF